MPGNNKQRQNYFDQMIRQYGEDFIVHITPDNIQRSAKRRIFREMISGNIDYSVYGKYFQDPKFFDNLQIAASDELQNNQIILYALTEYDYNHPGMQLVITNKAKYTQLVYIYYTICNALYETKVDGYNISHLVTLTSALISYRNAL